MIFAALVGSALAQDAETPAAEAPPAADAPAADAPATDAPAADAPAADAPAADAEKPADDAPPAKEASPGLIGEGWRIAPMGAASGLRIGEEAVIGRAGGTNATTIEARGVLGKNWLAVSVPFGAFRTPAERGMDIGNIGIDGWRGKDGKHGYRAFGLELTVPTGGHAWTWTNQPEDLWPNAGLDFAWQGARDLGSLKLLHRAALGVHFTGSYEPVPAVWLRLNGAVAIDAPIGDRFGVTGELSMQTWDTSPLELNGLFRANLIEGLDARAGVVFPIGVWAGWTPSDQRAGISETTFLVDFTMSL